MTKIKGYRENVEYTKINGKETEVTTLTIYADLSKKEVENVQLQTHD